MHKSKALGKCKIRLQSGISQGPTQYPSSWNGSVNPEGGMHVSGLWCPITEQLLQITSSLEYILPPGLLSLCEAVQPLFTCLLAPSYTINISTSHMASGAQVQMQPPHKPSTSHVLTTQALSHRNALFIFSWDPSKLHPKVDPATPAVTTSPVCLLHVHRLWHTRSLAQEGWALWSTSPDRCFQN